MSFDFSICLSFSDLPQEVGDKRESMLVPSDRVIHELLDFSRNVFGPRSMADLNRTIEYIGNLRTASVVHTRMNLYLAHPIRIAIKTGRIMKPPHLDSINLSLLHNVYELAGIEETELQKAGFCGYIQSAVRILTMDRTREFDKQYLAGYYGDIEDFGREVALIKCLDKLDNILGLELMEEGESRTRYLELALALVGPMAHRLSPDLGEYFCEACKYMQRVGSQPALCQQYLRYISASSK